MPAFSVNKKTIGTTGRDFATITLWEATLSGVADDVNRIGEVFADSDFDERPTISELNQSDPSIENPILVAAPGQRPVIKPTTNGNILTLGMNDLQIIGITVDGSSQPGGNGVGFNSVSGAFRHIFVGCEARFCKSSGFHFNTPHVFLYCLSHNNGAHGFFSIASTQGLCIGCGAAKNTLNGFKGLNASNFLTLRGCWSLDNTGDDVEHIGLTSSRFVYISDTSITDQGAPTHTADIFESQSSGSLGFTNFVSDDYTLAVGSTLRQKDSRFAHRIFGQDIDTSPQLALQDVFANNLEANIGDRLDVGPHQPSIATVTVTAPAAPVITKVVAGNLQVTVSLTGDAGKTHEVFFFTPGATVPTSGGTRVGDGDIIIGSLTNGITIDVVAATQATATTFGEPSTSVAATPVATASAPVGQWPNLVQRIIDFYLNSSDFLSWINVFDAGETTANHVFLGYHPTNIQDLLTKGPVALIHVGERTVTNSGQQTSYDGKLNITVHHHWAEDDDTPDTHMLAYNKMAAIENALLKLDPLQTTFGSAVMEITGSVTAPSTDADDQWVGVLELSLDWGPGE